MPAVPSSADALANLPFLFGRGNGRDVTNDLVTGNQGVLGLREDAILGRLVAVREASQRRVLCGIAL